MLRTFARGGHFENVHIVHEQWTILAEGMMVSAEETIFWHDGKCKS